MLEDNIGGYAEEEEILVGTPKLNWVSSVIWGQVKLQAGVFGVAGTGTGSEGWGWGLTCPTGLGVRRVGPLLWRAGPLREACEWSSMLGLMRSHPPLSAGPLQGRHDPLQSSYLPRMQQPAHAGECPPYGGQNYYLMLFLG